MITAEGCPPCARLKPVAKKFCEELGIEFKDRNIKVLPRNIANEVTSVPYMYLLDDSDPTNPIILNEWINNGDDEDGLYNKLTKKY